MSLALWREVEPLEPLLDSQWLDLLQGVLAPLGSNVVLQQRLIAARSRVPFGQLFCEVSVNHRAEGHQTTAWVLCVDTKQECLCRLPGFGLGCVLPDGSNDETPMRNSAIALNETKITSYWALSGRSCEIPLAWLRYFRGKP